MKKVRGGGFSKEYDWRLYPEAEKFLKKQMNNFLSHNTYAKNLAKKIEGGTSTYFFDWIDHIVIPEKNVNLNDLKKYDFHEDKKAKKPTDHRTFKHSESIFFPLVLTKKDITELAIKPEEIEKFHKVYGKSNKIEGKKHSRYRRLIINSTKNYIFTAVERRGYNGFIIDINSKDIKKYEDVLHALKTRKRHFSNDEQGIKKTLLLVRKLTQNLNKARVADAFFRAERIYWQERNKAGQIQKARQDKFGLGWGNHDHHTYRSSRENFTGLTKILETLGLECRESFHAGKQAGWGAQIMEHPICNIVTFSDLDISEEEKNSNFAHKKLKHRKQLGTVGLWVGLHGESILQAGMHHLECRFNFEKLRRDFTKHNIKTMAPFSYFTFLKQAFTRGEKWKVNKNRAKKLLKQSSITKLQYKTFIKYGAIGSHMENLQRKDGFKGFNQNSVSTIINATDPRKRTKIGA